MASSSGTESVVEETVVEWIIEVRGHDLILVLGVRVLNGRREIESLPVSHGSVFWSGVVKDLNSKKGTWTPRHFR